MAQAVSKSPVDRVSAFQPLPEPPASAPATLLSTATQVAQRVLESTQEASPPSPKRPKICSIVTAEEHPIVDNPAQPKAEGPSLDKKRKMPALSSEDPPAKVAKTQEGTVSVSEVVSQKLQATESVAASDPFLEEFKTELRKATEPWHKEMLGCLSGWYYRGHRGLLNENITSLNTSIDQSNTLEELRSALEDSKKTLVRKGKFLIGSSKIKLKEGLEKLNQFLDQISAKLDGGKAKE